VTAVTIVNELTVVAALPVVPVTTVLTKVSFATRLALIRAAALVNPGDPLDTIVTQLATVVAKAQTLTVVNRI
jgi:hypothetical protein